MEAVDPRIDPKLVPEGSVAYVIAEHQEEFKNLPAIVTPAHRVITRWQLSDEEKKRFLEGEDIFLTMIGVPMIPIIMTVGPIDWNDV